MDIICKKIQPSDTDLMDQIHRLRYQVYVHERKFLSVQEYPDGKEKDVFDAESIHFAAMNRLNEVIGTVRLIPSARTPTQIDLYNHKLQINEMHTLFPYAEISRFCISKDYLRRFVRMQTSLENYLNPITFAFYKAMWEECEEAQIETVFALMEDSLANLLERSGLRPECVGKAVDLYGTVRPYKMVVREQKKAILRYYRKRENYSLV